MIRYIILLCLFIMLKLPLGAVNFVLFTQPKTGTHLLIPILSEMTGKEVYWAKEFMKDRLLMNAMDKDFLYDHSNIFFSVDSFPWSYQTMDEVWQINQHNNTFLHLHAPYTPAMEAYLMEKECVNFFIKRDPRDQIVSLLNHYKYIQCNEQEVELISTDNEKLLYLIRKHLKSDTVHYMNWIESPVCCVLDFNQLMGSHGGVSTDKEALNEMRKIAKVLKINTSDRYLKMIYKKHFGRGWNFFRGKAGSWREYFHEEHKEAVKEEIGDLLIKLGYEKDHNW